MTAARDEIHDVSAFLAKPDDVDVALERLVTAGVARDLIDVVVSATANARHYGGHARKRGSQMARYAGAGALIGLLVGVVLSLEIILVFPALEPPARELSLAQFLGPNVGMMIGAIIGGVLGALIKRPITGPLRRAGEQDGILVVVRSQPAVRDEAIRAALTEAQARDIVVTRQSARKRRW